MDVDRHRERTKLLPLNLHSQAHFQSPPKQRHHSNAAIPSIPRRDSVDKDFEHLLKRANYPYLSKVSLGRKRYTSNKRPERTEKSYNSGELHMKTQPKKGTLSESKAKSRYYTKPAEEESIGNPKRFFYQPATESTEKASSVSVKNGSLGSRSCNSLLIEDFLKKLKERYGNKHIRQATEKPELQISSEKVTLLHHSNAPQEDMFEDDQGVQTMVLAEDFKFMTPEMVVRKFGDRMRTFEREVEVNQYKEIWYFTEDCLPENQPILENETVEVDELVYDDKEYKLQQPSGGYLWKQKSHIGYRYEISGMLGQGSFGQVFKCIDHKQEEQVAVKMVRNRQKYTKQAQIEIDILNFVRASDPNATKNLVLAKDNFRWRQHTVYVSIIQCIVFELLSMNLYELIKMNDYYGLPLDLIRRFSLQLLNGMHVLHKHEIIHADLKPENVLLKQPNKSGLKIIDFGSSCFIRNRIYTYIQSRYYRAPQVILGVPYDYKIDVWSFACIIAELYIGYPIFPGENEKEQMWLIMETIGLPSRRLLEDSTRRHHYFDQMFRPLPYSSSKGKEYSAMTNPLNQIIDSKDRSFCRFLESCFVWEAEKRPTALQCLRHEWIMEGLPEDIRKQHLRFIEQEENMLRGQRRRSPAVREMKMNESPPARARPAYFDRSRERQRFQVEGRSKAPQTKAFVNIEGMRR